MFKMRYVHPDYSYIKAEIQSGEVRMALGNRNDK